MNLTPITHEGITYLVDEKQYIPKGKYLFDGIMRTISRATHDLKAGNEFLFIVAQPINGTLDGVPYYKEEEEKILDIEPVAMKAGDKTVLINGEPIMVDFRVISEANYQLLLSAKGEFTEEDMRVAIGKSFLSKDVFYSPAFENEIINSLRPKKRIIGATVEMMLQVRHGVEWYDLPGQTKGRDPKGIYRHIPSTYIGEDGKNYLKVKLEYENQ